MALQATGQESRPMAIAAADTGRPKTMGVGSSPAGRRPSRYESQKRRDWQMFARYLGARRLGPPLQPPVRCGPAHVLDFLRYLDRLGKTRVHAPPCAAYGAACLTITAEACQCQCPRHQAWGSLDALVGRLRAAFAEHHGAHGSGTAQESDGAGASANPFAARDVTLYLHDVRDAQSRARGIPYNRKKKKQNNQGADCSC